MLPDRHRRIGANILVTFVKCLNNQNVVSSSTTASPSPEGSQSWKRLAEQCKYGLKFISRTIGRWRAPRGNHRATPEKALLGAGGGDCAGNTHGAKNLKRHRRA